MVKSCYIHIPFCNKICSYCDFCKLIYHQKFIKSYLSRLKEEINTNYNGESLNTIYIGGGTPSCLNLDELEELFDILSVLKKNDTIEYTIECNIESIDDDKVKLFIKNGINRISIGIESIDSNNLKLLERDFDREECISKINMIRRLGISNINLDLMYALPEESIDALEKDLDFVLSFHPEHISTYSLIIEEHTKLSIQKIKNINDELDSKMYQVICNKLKENGYIHYEISNFSREGYESRHNLCYWKNEEYYGFGLGASSYLLNKRYTNTRSIMNYPKVNTYEELTNDDIIEYEVLLGLRLLEGIDLISFKEKYHKELIDLYDYRDLAEKGFLTINHDHLAIPEDKIYVSNEIIVELLNRGK